MLEYYNKNRTLRDLETQLPKEVEEVKSAVQKILKNQPSDIRALMILARCHLIDDELGGAKHTFETLLTIKPDHVQSKVELAKIHFNQNETQVAIDLLTQASNAKPEIADNWQLLSEYLSSGNMQEASKNALKQHDMIKAFNDNLALAQKAFSNADFNVSDKMCRQLLQLVPGEVRVFRLLARIAKQFRHYEICTSVLARCVEAQPDNAALGLDYAYALLAAKKHQEALEQCHRLIGFAPEDIEIYALKAEVSYNLGLFEEAIVIYRELSTVPEKRILSLIQLGKVLTTVGETNQAIDCFHQALESEPASGRAFWELGNLKTYRFSADEVASMRKVSEAEETRGTNKVLVDFALGKALEDAQEFSESFHYYQAANSAYSQIHPSDYVTPNPKLISFFTPGYFAGQKENGNESDAPVFVVGLPRSGSTLVEQILTSHSQVDATMELDEMISIVRELNTPDSQGQGKYPQSLAGLNAGQIQVFAQRYLDFTQQFRQEAPYFVDKLPGNFQHIGLIKTLFPNAKIIDIRRNPIASGWSVYKQFFADSFLFSYDLATIGQYYKDYIELMDHWHATLPGQILTIKYEDMINDLPGSVETLLQYCGLKFEDACVDFHLNKRAVATPSSEQVRQPIYENALEQWKNYDEFLMPLKMAVQKDDLSPAS